MNVQLINNTTAAATLVREPERVGGEFASVLKGQQSGSAAKEKYELSEEESKTIRTAAEQLVATTFINPMLAKMRDDPFKSDLFHGGRGEEIFGQQLDTMYSDRIVSSTDFAIVDAVYDRIARSAATNHRQESKVDTHA